jgi:hypothetical protein
MQIGVYFILFSLISSIIYLILEKKISPISSISFFLLVTLIIELVANHRSHQNKSNIEIYNIYIFLNFLFFINLIKQFTTKKIAKKIFNIIIFLYLIFSFVIIFLIQGIHKFGTIAYAVGCILIVFGCAYYFIEILLRPTPVTLVRNPEFWVCSGLFFFYAVSFPIYGFTNFVMSLPSAFLRNFNLFIQILNIILYTMFSIAFLCRFKVTKSPLSLYLEPY